MLGSATMPSRYFLPLILSASLFSLNCGDDEAPSDSGVLADSGSRPDAGPMGDSGARDLGGDAGVDAGVSDSGDLEDAGASDVGFVPPAYGQWIKYEPPGAVCANGSQYKFFVNFSRTSSNVVIFLQGGGACWDYASCTGTGIRSAANKDGIPDDYAAVHANFGAVAVSVDVVYPLLNNQAAVNPMSDWNKVFVPYCTGDVYSGDTTVTYEDPDGLEPNVTFHHRGHSNVLGIINMLSDMFPAIPQMLVGGCSAGGAGSLNNYYFFRTGLGPDRGYLLDDSGPLFPDSLGTSRSLPLHNRVRSSWNTDPLISSVPRSSELLADLGNLPTVLAAEFPSDRLANTYFRLDYNYSLYSYERFYERGVKGDIEIFGDGSGTGGLGLDEIDPFDRAAVYELWWDDTDLLTAQFDGADNLSYYLPFYRTTNSSHCATIPGFEEFPSDEVLNLFINDFPRLAWAGTEMYTGTATINMRDYVVHLLDDDTALESYFEAQGEGRYLACSPDDFDEAACIAAHD